MIVCGVVNSDNKRSFNLMSVVLIGSVGGFSSYNRFAASGVDGTCLVIVDNPSGYSRSKTVFTFTQIEYFRILLLVAVPVSESFPVQWTYYHLPSIHS